MPGAQPGSNSRGRGGKFKKFTRGGGKHFSRDLRPLDADGNEISMWSADAQKKRSSDDSEEDSEEESSSSEEEEDGTSSKPQKEEAAMTREERRQAVKARKQAALARKKAREVQVGDMPSDDEEEEDDDDDDDDGDMPANPNHSKAARNQTKPPAPAPVAADAGVDAVTNGVKTMGAPSGANRKERESAEAALAREKYRRLHEQGKTDEAKADLERLKAVREQREAEAARRQAEKEEKDEREKSRRAEFEAKEAKKREAALGKKAPKKSSK